MIYNARTRSSRPLLWSVLFASATPILVAISATAAATEGPAQGRRAMPVFRPPTSRAPVRTPARSPARVRPTPSPRAPGNSTRPRPTSPPRSGRIPIRSGPVYRPPVHNHPLARNKGPIAQPTTRPPTGGSAGRTRRLPSPVALTVDTVAASPEAKASARAEARKFFKLHVKPSKVSSGVRKVTKLRWYDSIEAATRSAKKQNKPILWIQALGDLKGFT